MSDRPASKDLNQNARATEVEAADLVFLPAQLRDTDVRAELARALSLLSTAVHHVMIELRSDIERLPSREAITRWCRCRDAFDAISVLAVLLEVAIEVPEAIHPHTPASTQGERPANEPASPRDQRRR